MGEVRAHGVAGQPSTADDTAALVQFAIDHVLHSDPDFEGLPDVMERFAAAWHAEAALALTLPKSGAPEILAGHPPDATVRPALPAAIAALVAAYPAITATVRAGGAFQAPLGPGQWPHPASALIAWAATGAGEQRSIVVLIGDEARWNAQTRSVARMLASVVAAQLRHAGDRAHLRERESVTRTLIDASPDAVVVLDGAQRLIEFNPAAEALYGWRRADVLGKDISSMLIPPRERARFAAGMRSFLERCEPGEFGNRMSLRVLRADGGEQLVEFTPFLLVLRGQTHLCGFLRDMSEIERTKAALGAEERRFESLAQRATIGVAETGTDGRCTFVNGRWCAVTGGEPADHLGRPWLSVIHDDDLGEIRQGWAQAIASGTELRADCRLRADSQAPPWVRLGVAPLPRHDGPPGFVITLTDLAGREPAWPVGEPTPEREPGGPAAEVHRLNSLIATAIPGIVVTDQDSRVTHLNESYRGLFGVTEPSGAYVGAPVARLAVRAADVFADPAEFIATMDRLAAGQRPVSGKRMACADGRVVECDYWPVFVAGDYRGDIWMFWDVTERSRQEERRVRQLKTVQEARAAAEEDRRSLAEQNTRLREFADLQAQFLITVSHELRGPLTSVVSYTELLSDEKGRLSAETAGFLDVIERNAQQMTRLVGDLLLLSRIETGVVPLDLTPVPVSDVVADAVRGARPAAARRGIDLKAEAGSGPPVQADRGRLRQVMENLLSNAIKFSLVGGSVRVSASWGQAQWRIDVADSGIGIPENEVDHVFDRFFRASNSRKAGRPGAGLGLAVVKALAELHGGRVEVRSAVGDGSTFTVYLPVPGPAG